jgi:O-antigen/teichoic acid export membrane protein
LIDRFDLIGLHNLVQPIIRLVGASMALFMGWGIRGFLIAWLCAAIAEFAVLWGMGVWCAHRQLGRILRQPRQGSATSDNPGIWRFLVASNADVTLSELAGRIAPLIVGWVLGPATAGLFAIAQRATVIIAQPAQILGNTAYAELARMVAAGEGGSPLRKTLLRVIGIALAAAGPVVIIAALFPTPIITLLGGSAFKAAGGIMVVLIAARMIAVIGPPCSSALSAMGYPALSMSANLFASLIFLPVLPWLLNQAGLMGAGLQAVGQATLSSALLAALVWRRSQLH